MDLASTPLYGNRNTPRAKDYPSCSRLALRLRFMGHIAAIAELAAEINQRFPSLEIERNLQNTPNFGNCDIVLPFEQINSFDIRDHVDWFLKAISIEEYDLLMISKRGIVAELHCRWESKCGMGGPTLWPEQMLQLGHRGIDVLFDFRFDCGLWWQTLPLVYEYSNEGRKTIELAESNCERTTAELRIYPVEIDNTSLTLLLNTNSTKAISRGDLRPNGKAYQLTVWSLSSESFVVSTVLGNHLDWLLSKIRLSINQQITLQSDSDLRISVFCVWWSKTGVGGPRITSQQMTSLAASWLELTIDAQYFEE